MEMEPSVLNLSGLDAMGLPPHLHTNGYDYTAVTRGHKAWTANGVNGAGGADRVRISTGKRL